MNILALDPSTDVTGIALVQFETGREPVILHYGAIHADRRRDRWARIRETRQQLSWVVHNLPATFDALAYELPFIRGQQATAAIHQSVGAYLSLTAFDGFEGLPVNTNSVKAALNAARFLPHYETDAARRQGRVDGKAAMIRAANERFGLFLSPSDDAIADAIGVALAAHKILTEKQTQRLQPKLRLRKVTQR